MRRVESPWNIALAQKQLETPRLSVPNPRPEPAPVWSQLRPWDPNSAAIAEQPSPAGEAVVPVTDNEDDGSAKAPADMDTDMQDAEPVEGPTQGCLALSSGTPISLAFRQISGSLALCLKFKLLFGRGLQASK